MEKQCRLNNSYRVSFHCQSHEEMYVFLDEKFHVNSFYFSLNDRLLSFPRRNEFFPLFSRRLINTMITLIKSRFLDFKPDFQSNYFSNRLIWCIRQICKLLYMINQLISTVRTYEVYFWIKTLNEINFNEATNFAHEITVHFYYLVDLKQSTRRYAHISKKLFNCLFVSFIRRDKK